MPVVQVDILIKAPPDVIFPVLLDMETYPSFMKDLVSVKVLERNPGGTLTDWVSNVDGRVIRWQEEDRFFPEEWRIEYKQTKGDLKNFEGEWTIAKEPEGSRVSLRVDFEFGIPMVAGLLNPLLKKKVRENSENMLSALKQRLEAGN